MRTPASLGTDLESIHAAWRELSRHTTSQHVVSALVPLVGRFAMREQRIVRIEEQRDQRGGATNYRDATRAELDEIDHAIASGTIQIEARTASGALGYAAPSELVRVYHQATGRALPSTTPATLDLRAA